MTWKHIAVVDEVYWSILLTVSVSKYAHFQIRRAYHVHFLRVQPLHVPADYTFRQTGVDVQSRQLLAVKCLVVVKKNCGKDDTLLLL